MLYPLKFKPILKQTIWGGNKLSDKSDNPNIKNSIGESWEISGVQDNISVVSAGNLAGNTLEELTEIYMGDLVGDKIYENFGIEFPLLIKYIDARENLSIQVHPNDTTAKERHNAYGKTEMWYLVEADPNAELVIGFNRNSNRIEYLENLRHHTLPALLNIEKVEKGNCFFIPAGTVHAICKGCFIAEIQQTSDITYRIYDYDRRDKDGNLRELHTELATDVINFEQQKQHAIPYHIHKNHTEELVRCNYFTTNFLKFDKEIEKDYIELDSFVIYMCLEGKFTLVYDVDQTIQVNKGETILVPAILKNLFLIPEQEVQLLEIYI
ncbi:MAG: type I phosphomannose isomerase catalytic subunit [Odoribacter sp.]